MDGKGQQKSKNIAQSFFACVYYVCECMFSCSYTWGLVCEGTCVFSVYACDYICMLCMCMFTCVGSHVCVNVYIWGVVCRCVYACVWVYMYIGLKLSVGIFLGHSPPCSESLPEPRAHCFWLV